MMRKACFFVGLFFVEVCGFVCGFPMERADEKENLLSGINRAAQIARAEGRREDYLEEENDDSDYFSRGQAPHERENMPEDEAQPLFSSERTQQDRNMEIKRTVSFSEVEQKTLDSAEMPLEGDFFGVQVKKNEIQNSTREQRSDHVRWNDSLVDDDLSHHRITPIDEDEMKQKEIVEKTLEPVESLQKKSNKQIGRYHRNFLKILNTLETDVDDIAEQDPEASAKKAAIYAKAYPELKTKLQELAAFIQQNQNDLIALRDKHEVNLLSKATDLLARNTQKLISVAAQTIDFKSIRPIKTVMEDDVCCGNVSIPARVVQFRRIEPEDAEAHYLIQKAETIESDLFSFSGLSFQSKSDAELSDYLSNRQKNLVQRANHLDHSKLDLIKTKQAYLSNFPSNDSPSLLTQLESQEKELSEKLAVFQRNKEQEVSPVTDVRESLETFIFDLLNKIQEAFDIAEELKTLLASRKPAMIFQQSVVEKRPFHPTLTTKLTPEEQEILGKKAEEALNSMTEVFFRQKHETEYLNSLLHREKQFQEEAVQQLHQLKEEQAAELSKTKKSASWWRLPSFSKTILPLSKDYDRLIDSAEKKYSRATQEIEKVTKEIKLDQDENRIENLASYLVKEKLIILNQLKESYPEKPYLAEAFLELYEKKCCEVRDKVAEELFYFSGIQPEQLKLDELK